MAMSIIMRSSIGRTALTRRNALMGTKFGSFAFQQPYSASAGTPRSDVFPTGDRHHRAFVSVKRSNLGSSIAKKGDGVVFEGELVHGKRAGPGKVIYPNGAVLKALWEDGVTVGDVEYTYPDGSVYTGDWMQKQEHGYGAVQKRNTHGYKNERFMGQAEHGVKGGEGKITYTDGRTLEGIFKDNKIHNGVGWLVYADGKTESGTWVKGKLQGHGKITYVDGQVLEGQFQVGRILNGYGAVVHGNGTTESGTWVNGKLHGDGVLAYSNGQTLQGEFQQGRIHNGRGHYIYPNGAVLKAVWQNCVTVGDVVYTDTDGSVYTGGWVNNRRHGRGAITYKDGNKLEGTFKQGHIHTGIGTLVFPNGAELTAEWRSGNTVGDVHYAFPMGDSYSYSGGWAGNTMHGYGTLADPWYTYMGHFEHGKKCGEGKITYTDGRTLEGTFRDGKIHNGVGFVEHHSGNTESGTWENGKLNGHGKFTHLNGQVLEGEFKSGRILNGSGVLIHADGNTESGTWVNGDLRGVRTYSTGQTLQGSFKQGRIHTGKGTLKCPDGAWITAEWLEGNLVGDVHYTTLDGTYVGSWSDDTIHGYGTLTNRWYTYVGQFEHGRKCGEGKITYTDGRTLEGTFRDGKIHNGVCFIVHLDGTIESGTWENGKLNGQGWNVDADGDTESVSWVTGKLHGHAKITYADGQVLEGEFQEGRIHAGNGTLALPTGAKLTAVWRDGAVVGEVHHILPNGDAYTGSWAGDTMHGHGSLASAKYTYVGHFEHGRKCGEGKVTYSDGRTLEGTFKNDKIQNGVGVVRNLDERPAARQRRGPMQGR